MDNYIKMLPKIKVASTNSGVQVTDRFENISGSNLLAQLNTVPQGEKDGSHWLRTSLRFDDTGRCKSRSNANMEAKASVLILDCDKRITVNGEEMGGAPDPLSVSRVLKDNNIGHVLYGSYSHYTGEKGNRYRIVLIAASPYSKEQLPPTVESIVVLINIGLAKLGCDLLGYAKENNTWAQPWYYPRKPMGCSVEALYLEYMEGQLVNVIDPLILPPLNSITPKVKQFKPSEISVIHAFNGQYNITDQLTHYGYKRVLKTAEYERWLSPESTSDKAGIIVQDGKFFSFHNDEFNDQHRHDCFDLMRVREGLTVRDAIIKAAQQTLTPDGRTVDEHNKSLASTKKIPISFKEYQPFNNELLPVEDVPYHALPNQMANLIKEQSDIRGCPPDFILVSILARMGVLFAGKIKIALTRNTNWHVIPNFFWVMVGSPSSGKSNALSATGKPLQSLEAAARDVYKNELRAFQEEMDLFEHQLNATKKGMDKENGKAAPSLTIIELFETRVKNIQQKMYDCEDGKPKLKIYTVNKLTLEKLILIIKENPAGILLELDEVISLLIKLSKDEHAEERGFFLSGYNGNTPFSNRTISRGEDLIDRVVLSIIGGTQPSKLERIVKEVKNDTSNDGFLQRFQGVVFPNKKLRLPQDKNGEKALEIELDNLFKNLDALSSTDQVMVHFNDEAQIFFDNWRENATTQAHDLEPHLSAHVGKSYEFTASLSIYLYLYENNGQLPERNEISVDYVMRAIQLGAYFLSHAKRMYGLAYKDNMPARSLAAKLVNLVKVEYFEVATQRYFFTRSQFRKNDWSDLNTKEERLDAIQTLIDRGYISEQIEGKFYINPMYIDE